MIFFTKLTSFLIIIFFLASITLERALGFSMTSIKGLSLKNISFYSIFLFWFFNGAIFKKPFFEKNNINFYIIFFTVYCFFLMLFTHYFGTPTSSSIKSAIIQFKSTMDYLLLFILIFNIIDDVIQVKFLFFSLIIFFLFLNIITILGSFGYVSFSKVVLNESLGRTSGAFGESNQYAAYISLFLPFCISIAINHKSLIYKSFLIFVSFIGFFCLFLTGSRGGVLAVFVGLFFLLFIFQKNLNILIIIKLLIFTFLTIILLISSYFLLPENSQLGIERNFISRANEEDISDYSSGRIEIWEKGLSLFFNNPIFGTGWQTFSKKVGVSSHNEYIHYLTTTGIIGFFLFISIFIKLFQSVIKYRLIDYNNIEFYNGYLSGFLAFLVAIFFVNMHTPYYFFAAFSSLIIKLGVISIKNSSNYQYA